jgi:hypothetical protein
MVARQLDLAAARDELAINDIVYAELSVGYARIEELDEMIRRAGVICAAIPRIAFSSQARLSYDTARRVASGPGCYPISFSALTPPYPIQP